MADYRNLTIQFALGGLNLAQPPEALQGGQLTRALNLRANVEGVIEARPTKGSWSPIQKVVSGYRYPYPSQWNMGPLVRVRYIGNVTADGVEVPGYMSVHEAAPGDVLPFCLFINGALVKTKSAYNTYGYSQPFGYSIIKANARNGIPIIVLDGQYYIALKDCNLDSPFTTESISTGYITLNPLPVLHVKHLGIPKPAAAPTVAANSTGLTGTYQYRFSGYDSATGFQGPPSASSATVTLANQGARVTFVDTNAFGNFDTWQFWRLGGTLANTWRLVGTKASTNAGAAQTFDDNMTDLNAALAEALDLDTVEIFSTITSAGASTTGQKFSYAFGPYVGKYIFWVGDPVRQNYVYWNKATDLGRHDPSYDVNAVSDPNEVLLNGFVFGNSPYVFSDKRLYALDFGGPDAQPAFVPREVPIGMGCAGPFAFAVGPNQVFMCSKDGIYMTSCQPEIPTNITNDTLKPIFRGESRGDLEAIDYARADEIRMESTNKELHFIYPGKSSGNLFHLVYDFLAGRWLEWTQHGTSVVYSNEGTAWNQLILGNPVDRNTYYFDDVFSNVVETFDAQFRSGSTDLGAALTHKEFGVLLLDYDPRGADITITPYYNSELNAGTPITTDTDSDFTGRRVDSFSLDDYYARSIALDFSWTEAPSIHPRIYQAVLLYREDEEEINHFEHPPQSLGQGGLYHIKDSYWGIRSNSTIDLYITVDGHEYFFPAALPNTSGVRKKVYFEFPPALGTVWGFRLEASSTFRFYGEDTVLFAKPWQTENAYQALTPFSQAGYAAFLRKGGGT